MTIDRLHVENFKSIREVDVEFSHLNIFVGRNAAGKSNLFEVFQFLRDARDVGLDDAVQLQGGIEYLRNKSIGSKKDTQIRLEKTKHNNSIILLKIDFDKNKYGVVSDQFYSLKTKQNNDVLEPPRLRSVFGVFSGLEHIENIIESKNINDLEDILSSKMNKNQVL